MLKEKLILGLAVSLPSAAIGTFLALEPSRASAQGGSCILPSQGNGLPWYVANGTLIFDSNSFFPCSNHGGGSGGGGYWAYCNNGQWVCS
jgi:hypothetical protein